MACFAEACIVSENRLTLLPEGLDPRFAPLFGCALTTAYGVVTNDVQIRPGDSVMVIGAGGVGLAIIQMAALLSAWHIVAIDPVEKKRAMAKEFGATGAFETIGGMGGLDAVIDTTGTPITRRPRRAPLCWWGCLITTIL
jgi:S-(hydroxymethyl)glutathione dehydrogenase/alcohol dehydrogenase